MQAVRPPGCLTEKLDLDGRDVWVEFPFSAAYLEQIAGGTGGASGGTTQENTQETTQETTQERIWIERLGDRLGERLGETVGRVLFLIHGDSKVSTRILADEIGVSTTAMDKTLARLKDKGILRRVGPARGGHWEIPSGSTGSPPDTTSGWRIARPSAEGTLGGVVQEAKCCATPSR